MLQPKAHQSTDVRYDSCFRISGAMYPLVPAYDGKDNKRGYEKNPSAFLKPPEKAFQIIFKAIYHGTNSLTFSSSSLKSHFRRDSWDKSNTQKQSLAISPVYVSRDSSQSLWGTLLFRRACCSKLDQCQLCILLWLELVRGYLGLVVPPGCLKY